MADRGIRFDAGLEVYRTDLDKAREFMAVKTEKPGKWLHAEDVPCLGPSRTAASLGTDHARQPQAASTSTWKIQLLNWPDIPARQSPETFPTSSRLPDRELWRPGQHRLRGLVSSSQRYWQNASTTTLEVDALIEKVARKQIDPAKRIRHLRRLPEEGRRGCSHIFGVLNAASSACATA